MNLETDARQLNERFAQGNRLIFWFDAEDEFSEEIDGIRVEARLVKLTGSNYLAIKALIEHEDPQGPYLIYAPFARPADEDNPLADTVYYSLVYSKDKVSAVMEALQLPEKLRQHLKRYPKYWKADMRVQKLITLGYTPRSEQEADLAMLCALCNVRTVHMDEVCGRLMTEQAEKRDNLFKSIEQLGLSEAFWQLCALHYGYREDSPSLKRLIASMFCTHMEAMGIELPQRLKAYVTEKKNNVSVMLSNYLGNEKNRAAFDLLSADYARALKVREVLEATRSERMLDLESFADVDEVILSRALRALLEEAPQRQIAGMDLAGLLEKRARSGLHFGGRYQARYEMLLWARELMELLRKDMSFASAKEMAQAYQKDLYRGDTAYRKFFLLYDRLPGDNGYERLAALVERLYVNEWLDKLTRQFSEHLEEGFGRLGLPMQRDFAAGRVSPRAGRERTVVIISDAFRYECARELLDVLQADIKYEARLEAMEAEVPTVTEIGMASLLPHKKLEVAEDLTVTVDGLGTSGSVQRHKALLTHYPNAAVAAVDDILKMSKSALHESFNGKDVIYLYHNQIDARGDSAKTENEVLEACESALEEIERCIRRMTDNLSATYYLITADHGFQYRRSPMEEHEKIEVKGNNPLCAAKRYRVTGDPEQLPGTISFPCRLRERDACISFPRNASVFKQQGGSGNYTHGGISPAELLVPLLTVRTRRGRQQVENARIQLLSTMRRIGNLIFALEFLQQEPVSDTVKETHYKAVFVDSRGMAVSGEETIPAISDAEGSAERIIRKSFTLQNRRYNPSDSYFLELRDVSDALAQPERIEFQIDIAFADDFNLG